MAADKSWMLTGDAVLANVETRMVLFGNTTYWTNNRNKSVMITKNPFTGNEDRMVLIAPRPWWVIQHQMQMFEEQFSGTPMLEVERKRVDGICSTCGGAGGGYDHNDNWIDCPECEG